MKNIPFKEQIIEEVDLPPSVKPWKADDFQGLPKWTPTERMPVARGRLHKAMMQHSTTVNGVVHDHPAAEWDYMVDPAGNVMRVVLRTNHLDPNDPATRDYTEGSFYQSKDIILNRKRKMLWVSVFNPNDRELVWAGARDENGQVDMEKYHEWLTRLINSRRAVKHQESQRFRKETEAEKMLETAKVQGKVLAEEIVSKFINAEQKATSGKRKRAEAKAD